MTTAELIALLKKNPISVGCAAVTLGLAVWTYIDSDDPPRLSTELDQVSTESHRLAANIKNSAQLHEQLNALAAARVEIEPRIVHVSELAKNLQYFYRIEAETGTKITDLQRNNQASPLKPGPKGVYAPVGFTVSVEGEYPSILEFLRRLENGTHFCRVISGNLAKGGNDVDRSGPLKLNLTLELLGQP